MMNREGLIYTVLVTFIVSFVFVGLLAVANEFTKAQVAQNDLLFERRAILNAVGIRYDSPDQVFALYDERVQIKDYRGIEMKEATVGGQTVEAVRFSGPGLWGEITGVVAFERDLSRIVGLDIISHNETPGLGGRIAEPWFTDQFRGERIVNGQIQVTGGDGKGDPDKDNGRVDSITGATRTSTAMQVMLNARLAQLEEALK
jgi:Na+-transporting NADH:ubiquinone oxidoreductase subunit C